MKTTTKLLAVLLVLTMACGLLASCGGKSIVGKWEAGTMTYEFKGDGTYTLTVAGQTTEGKYEIKDGKLSFDGLGGLAYSVSGDKLTINLMGMGEMEFTKAK